MKFFEAWFHLLVDEGTNVSIASKLTAIGSGLIVFLIFLLLAWPWLERSRKR